MASSVAAEALAVACAFVENYYTRFASTCQLLMPMYSPEARLCLGGSASPAKPTTFDGRASIARHLEALDQQLGIRKLAITAVDAVATPTGAVIVTADGKVLAPSCDRSFSHVFYLTPIGVNQYCISAEVLRFHDETKYDNGFPPVGVAPLSSAAPQALTPSPLSPAYPQPAPIVPLGVSGPNQSTPYPARSQLNSAAVPFTRPLGAPLPASEPFVPKSAPQPPAPVVTTPPRDSAVISYQRAAPVSAAAPQVVAPLPAAPAKVFEEPDEDERRKTPPPAPVPASAKKDESDAEKRRGNRANDLPKREKPIDAEKKPADRAKESEHATRPARADKSERDPKKDDKPAKPPAADMKKPTAGAREEVSSPKEARNGDAAGRAGREKLRKEEREQPGKDGRTSKAQTSGKELEGSRTATAAVAPQKGNKQVVLFNVPTEAKTDDVEYYAEAFGPVAEVEWMGSRHAIVSFKRAGDAQAMLDYENFTIFHKPVRRAAYVEKEKRVDAPAGEETERPRGDRKGQDRNGKRSAEKEQDAPKPNAPKDAPRDAPKDARTAKPSAEAKVRTAEHADDTGKAPSAEKPQRSAAPTTNAPTAVADNGTAEQKDGSSRNRRRR